VEYSGEALSWRHDDGVLEVELHRAPLNEIGTTMLRELELLVTELDACPPRALLFWSSRPGFCAGADLRELHAGLVSRSERAEAAATKVGDRLGPWVGSVTKKLGSAAVRRELASFVERIHAVFDTIDGARIPTIAAVHGVVFGGGLELALTCDLVVADRSARFCFPELRLGIVPGFGGVPRLERDLGNAIVRDLLLSGRSLGAVRAHTIGLVSQVVPKGGAPDAARRLARQVIRVPSETLAAAKRFAKPIPRARLDEEKRLFVDLLSRADVVEALDRFVRDEGVRPYLATEAT
jgi:enoyl-CoA hydratase/carnithine racemase